MGISELLVEYTPTDEEIIEHNKKQEEMIECELCHVEIKRKDAYYLDTEYDKKIDVCDVCAKI